jgi:hypothetical protein
MNLFKGNMPDITPPQAVAAVVAGIPIIAELLRAFGVYDLSVEQQDALSNAVTWAGVLGGALIGGDALLRTGRNLRKGQVEAAIVAGPSVNPDNAVVDGTIVEATGGTTYTPPTQPPLPPPPEQPQPAPPINPATGLPGNQ